MSLEIIFKAMQDASTKLRKKTKNADGLAFWSKYKGELSKYDSIKVDWCVKGPILPDGHRDFSASCGI
jgi:hypothetical protein